MIRKAKPEDREQGIILIKEFFKESLNDYGLSLDDKTIEETADSIINSKIAIVAETDKIVGVIAGVVSPSMFDKNQLIGQEIIWYVDKSARNGTVGLKLIKAFEEECRKQGAQLVAMVHMGNLYAETLDKFYKRRNYRLLERQYIKEI